MNTTATRDKLDQAFYLWHRMPSHDTPRELAVRHARLEYRAFLGATVRVTGVAEVERLGLVTPLRACRKG